MNQKVIKLAAPNISLDHIKEKIICIRGHRERIFNVSAQIKDSKLICHNYGQGGAGWTFLFGCVNESIRQFKENLKQNSNLQNKDICVVGAGCYGLLTAVILARQNHKVQIIAENIENISSNKSAGFFFPRHRKCSTEQEKNIFKNMGIESYRTYKQIIDGQHEFIKTGPKILSAYYGPEIDPGFGPYIEHKLVSEPEPVIIDFGNNKTYKALEYKTVFINSQIIMQELWENIKKLNIKIIQKKINDFNEISDQIIFNCAGIGAKELNQDKKIIPVQGHLITLKDQENLDQMQYMLNFKVVQKNSNGTLRDELIYFAPKESGILGITFLRGQDSLTSNQHEFDRLLQRCQDFFGA